MGSLEGKGEYRESRCPQYGSPGGLQFKIRFDRSARRSGPSSRGYEPGGIEPAIGFAVIGQPGDIPVADEGCIGLPHRRTAADINDAVGEPRQHFGWGIGRANLADGPVLIGEGRDRGDGDRARDDDMPARDLEEPRHVGDIFAALVAFPGKPAIEPELAALAYGAHGANVAQAFLLPDRSPIITARP